MVIDSRKAKVLERLLPVFTRQLVYDGIEPELAAGQTVQQRADVVWGHRRGIVPCWEACGEPETRSVPLFF